MAKSFPRLILSNQPHRIERGHGRVYRNEIQKVCSKLNNGNIEYQSWLIKQWGAPWC